MKLLDAVQCPKCGRECEQVVEHDDFTGCYDYCWQDHARDNEMCVSCGEPAAVMRGRIVGLCGDCLRDEAFWRSPIWSMV